jgi:hypothetical protein
MDVGVLKDDRLTAFQAALSSSAAIDLEANLARTRKLLEGGAGADNGLGDPAPQPQATAPATTYKGPSEVAFGATALPPPLAVRVETVRQPESSDKVKLLSEALASWEQLIKEQLPETKTVKQPRRAYSETPPPIAALMEDAIKVRRRLKGVQPTPDTIGGMVADVGALLVRAEELEIRLPSSASSRFGLEMAHDEGWVI